jgi:hypothetical protein
MEWNWETGRREAREREIAHNVPSKERVIATSKIVMILPLRWFTSTSPVKEVTPVILTEAPFLDEETLVRVSSK